ncbi:hypothetical protein Tco_1013126 [Tanacetum coccineum]
MGAVGISGVEVVVSDSESSEHRKGETIGAIGTEGSELSDGSAFDDEYQAQAPRQVGQLQPPPPLVQPGLNRNRTDKDKLRKRGSHTLD